MAEAFSILNEEDIFGVLIQEGAELNPEPPKRRMRRPNPEDLEGRKGRYPIDLFKGEVEGNEIEVDISSCRRMVRQKSAETLVDQINSIRKNETALEILELINGREHDWVLQQLSTFFSASGKCKIDYYKGKCFNLGTLRTWLKMYRNWLKLSAKEQETKGKAYQQQLQRKIQFIKHIFADMRRLRNAFV